MSDSMYQTGYISGATFNRLPLVTVTKADLIDVAFLGVPFDSLVTYRPGARFGPNAIRQSSLLCRSYSQQMEFDVYRQIRAADVGDVSVNSFDFEETFNRIEARIGELQQSNISVISLGGDHSILLPILRATVQNYSNLTLIQFDAHSDTSDSTVTKGKYHHGTIVRRAIEEGVIQGNRVFQIGIRGYLSNAEYNEFSKNQKINVLSMSDIHNSKVRDRFFNKLRETAGDDPCYLSFDIDGVDPAFAPGTGTPVVGGLTSFEALEIMRSLKGLQLIGGDVVEVAPAYDHSEITSMLGASIAFEIMALIAIGRQPELFRFPKSPPVL